MSKELLNELEDKKGTLFMVFLLMVFFLFLGCSVMTRYDNARGIGIFGIIGTSILGYEGLKIITRWNKPVFKVSTETEPLIMSRTHLLFYMLKLANESENTSTEQEINFYYSPEKSD